MTAPDSRYLDEAMARLAEAVAQPVGGSIVVSTADACAIGNELRRLQALARGPQQAGGEDYSPEEIASVVSDLRTLAKDGWIVADIAANLIEKLHPLQAEVARLTGEASNRHAQVIESDAMCADLRDRAETAEAALREAGRDAARYRFLRDPIINAWEPQPAAWIEFRGNEYIESDWLTGELADAAIDAALNGGQGDA